MEKQPYKFNSPIYLPRFTPTVTVHGNGGLYYPATSSSNHSRSTNNTTRPNMVSWAPVDSHQSISRRLDMGVSIQPVPPRPAKKRRMQDRPTSLRVNRPLKNSKGEPLMIPEDIWLHICDNLHPRDLLSMLNVCSFFWKRLRALDVTFKNARINNFGEDSPEPLPNMKERELAELSVGRGCMADFCVRTNTAKAYWAYGLRLCNECLQNQTIEASEARAFMLEDPGKHFLLNLIVGAQFSSGKYQRQQGYDEETHMWLQPSTTKTVFLKNDVTKISQEYDSVPVEVRESWKESKSAELSERRKAIKKLEDWSWDTRSGIASHRTKRSEFFEAEAKKLDPSISAEMLKKMLPFRNALNSNRPPTATSWAILKPKLLNALPIVRQIMEIDRRTNTDLFGATGSASHDLRAYSAINEHRRKRDKPEQRYVIELADKILVRTLSKDAADADLVLLVLNEVHDIWSASPYTSQVNGLRANGTHGPHNLLMDDALMIIQHVISPEVTAWDDRSRAKVALESFRCPGCPRHDCKTLYKFEDLMAHIHMKHSCFGGDNEKYHTLRAPFEQRYTDHRFPFHAVEWPRCLPILPFHQTAQRDVKWDPDERPRYIEAPPTSTDSAFMGRQALPFHGCTEDDFPNNVLHAAQVMQSSTIPAEFKTKIAVQYALDCFLQGSISTELPLNRLKDAFKKLSLDDKAKLPFKHRCLSCVRGLTDTKFARTPQPFHALIEHFERKHSDIVTGGSNWVTDLLDLPSDSELLDQMVKADAELDAKKEEVRAKEAARSKTPRKKPILKAHLLLSTPPALDLFGKLYAPRL